MLYKHDFQYHERNIEDTLAKVMDLWSKIDWDSTLITDLDDIAWLTNLRGNDISHNPVFMSYCLWYKDTEQNKNKIILYTSDYQNSNEDTLSSQTVEDISELINSDIVLVKPYDMIFEDLKQLKNLQ